MTNKTIIFIFSILTVALSLSGYFYFERGKFARHSLSYYEKTNKNEAIKVPIFVYHSVSPYYPSESEFRKKFSVEPDIFEKQLRYLKEKGYIAISFDDLINHFSRNSFLPEKSVILTFDDGWESQYRYAFPILKKHNDTATFFIFTNAIDHKHFLTWPQIKELVAAGMTIGDHTKSHPYLYKITGKDKLRQEIIESRKILESNLGKKIDIFAYPFGHFNEEIMAILKEDGFRAARTDGYNGAVHTLNDLFTLKSIDAENDLTKFVEALNTTQ